MMMLFLFVLLGALGFAHVGLRFAIIDVRLQHTRLQDEVRKLNLEVIELEQQKEAACDTQALREFGLLEMQMVEADPRLQERVVVSTELRRKYAPVDGEAQGTLAAAVPVEDTRQTGRGVLMSLLDARPAFAAGR